MDDMSTTRTNDNDGMFKNAARVEEHIERLQSRTEDLGGQRDGIAEAREEPQSPAKRRVLRLVGKMRGKQSYSHTQYRRYKRRWFGLAQLVLLNTVVSWGWLTFAPISTTAALYFAVPESQINWLSTAFLFSFALAVPPAIWLLHSGPKDSIIAASVLVLAGNWIRFGGTRAKSFGLVMFGQILTGLAQPFVLAAPTRYSGMWFTERGRVGATALATLANPFGGALASLINPLLGDVPTTILIVSIIATVACIPSLFIPKAPPTPPTATSGLSNAPVLTSLRHMLRSPAFYIVFLTFGVYVGFFNAFTSLLNQILYPYGYSENEAGICGAVLIVAGLVVSGVTSPVLDRTHAYLLSIKLLCPFVALSYLAMVWAPQTRDLVAPYVLSAVLGASSFSLLPLSLEYLVEITYPASPEVSSTICWAGGQVFGGVFIVVMNALKDSRPVDLDKVREGGRPNGGGSRPPGNMYWALVFQAIISLVVLPLPLVLGVKRLGLSTEEGRLAHDEHREREVQNEVFAGRHEQ
ncbi:MFS general substrate transporter [Clathrospora elynae]|uniref:MFS general substrate transporter n=1 Tax=Clathrospora elynae TaxID=706981 RepID=A0A6A5S8G2_9PLEO|nr:MFS general substrate transporter [Clathrospora elynae]